MAGVGALTETAGHLAPRPRPPGTTDAEVGIRSVNTSGARLTGPGAAVADRKRAESAGEPRGADTVESAQPVHTLRLVLTAPVLLTVVNVLLTELA